MRIGDQFASPFALFLASGAILILLGFFVASTQGDLLYVIFAVPFVSLVCLALLITSAIRRELRQSLSVLLALAAFLGGSYVLLKHEHVIAPHLRWLLLSRHYKARVLQAPPANGQLRHLEWDGWGGAPVGDWTAYVVFDPNDSLFTAAMNRSSGKFSGIPCGVDAVQRLESHWYSVTLSMNEWWDRC